VNGQGGIGKTTLASKYYHKYQNQYSHLAWVLAEPSILEAVLRLAEPLGLDFPPVMEKEQRLEKLLTKMQNLEKPSLLILDNANDLKDLEKYYPYLRSCSNFHLLLTSRITKFKKIKAYQVKGLKEKDALILFQEYYEAHNKKEDELVLKIFEAVGENTLVIEILAKNLNNINNKLKTHYSLENLLQDIEEKGLLNIQKQRGVKVDWHTWKIDKTIPENIILAMYDLSNLEENEIILLSNFAVLPPENIPFEILEELLENTLREDKSENDPLQGLFDNLIDKMEEEELEGMFQKPQASNNQTSTTLDEILLSLAQKGFLDYNEEGASFKVSPVIQEIIKTKNKDRLPQDCQALLEKLDFLFETNNGLLKNIDYNQAPLYYTFAQAVFLNVPEILRSLGILGIFLGDYENNIGNLQKAIENFEKAKEIFQNIGDKHSFASTLVRLGENYKNIGSLKKSLRFFKEYKEVGKALYAKEPNNIYYIESWIISYLKMGEINYKLRNREASLKYFEEYNRLEKELHKNYPNNLGVKNNLAISYQYLGIVNSDLGKLEDALKCFEEYNRLEKELFEVNPNDVDFKDKLAISYKYLGNIHLSLSKPEEALGSYLKANKLLKELCEINLNNVNFKNGLATSYHKLGEFYKKQNNTKQAKIYFLECEKLLLELVKQSPKHKDFQDNLAEVQGDLKELE